MKLLNAIHEKLDATLAETQAIAALLEQLTQFVLSQGKKTMSSLSDLQAAVAATTTVQASALTLIKGLAAELATVSSQLSAAGADPAAVDALASTLTAQASAFAAAITANTPAAAAPTAPSPAPTIP